MSAVRHIAEGLCKRKRGGAYILHCALPSGLIGGRSLNSTSQIVQDLLNLPCETFAARVYGSGCFFQGHLRYATTTYLWLTIASIFSSSLRDIIGFEYLKLGPFGHSLVPMEMTATGPELHSLGADVFAIFARLLEPRLSLSSGSRVNIQEQRFTLWAHNLGLYRKGHSSLDYRVRDAGFVKERLCELLLDLKEHLENLLAISVGERPPAEETERAESDSDDDSESDDASHGSFHEVDFRLQGIVERIDAMYSLATKIRNPRNRPQRTIDQLYKYIPAAERRAFIKEREETEITVVAFVQRQQMTQDISLASSPAQTDLDVEEIIASHASSKHWLIRRTGIANARRKQQFVYWRRHADLISHGPSGTPARNIQQTHHAVADGSGNTIAPPPIATSGIPPTSLATSATKLDPQLVKLGDTKSAISYQSRVSTIITPQGTELQWPSPPKHLIRESFFTCPYCQIICPKSYLAGDGSAWQ